VYVRMCVCLTVELDWRRLSYLGSSMEEQLQLETKLVHVERSCDLIRGDHVILHML